MMNETTEMTRHEELACLFWDLYKDAHGFRPRHIDTSAMTEEDLVAELEALGSIVERQEAARIESEKEAAVRFEARILDLVRIGAGDRATALRWIHEAEGTQGDDDYLAYQLGLSWCYFRTAKSTDSVDNG
jgi:hypothetical protein